MTNRWAILALIMGAQTMANVGPLGIPAIAPLIRDSLGLSMTQAGSFLSAYYVGAALMSLPAGWMADRWGVASTMVAGQGVIALGLFTVSGSGSFPVLIAIMILAGTGYGMLNPTTAKAVISWFPRRQRATVVGLKQVGLPLGGAVGALLMPPLALWLGWRVTVALSASLIALLGAHVALLPQPASRWMAAPAPREGSCAPSENATCGWSMTTPRLRGMRTVWMAFLVLYLRRRSVPLVTATLPGMAQVTGMVGRVAFGLLSDRHFGGRRRIVLVIAGVGSTVCSLLMAATGPGTSAWVLAPLALGFGFFGIGWNGVQHTLMAELAGPRAAGTALGLELAVSSLGVSVWPPLFGLLVERAGGFGVPWTVLGLAMAGALCLLLPVREGKMDVP